VNDGATASLFIAPAVRNQASKSPYRSHCPNALLLRCAVAPLRETFFLLSRHTAWLRGWSTIFYSRNGATTQRKSGQRFHIWMEWFTKGTKKCLMLVSEVTVQMEGFAKMHNIFCYKYQQDEIIYLVKSPSYSYFLCNVLHKYLKLHIFV